VLNLGIFDLMKLDNVSPDTIMYNTREYPFFVPVEVVDSIWNDLSYKNNVIINNVKYSPVRKPEFYVLRSGNIILTQRIRRGIKEAVNYNDGLQIWYYLKKAKELEVTPDQLWNYPEVDSILNPIIINDTIQ
jgi:hypothetical protein